MNKFTNIIYESSLAKFYLEHLYTIECNITFCITIVSHGFMGSSNFCIHKETIQHILQMLKCMIVNAKGMCQIDDSDSDSFIVLEFLRKDLIINGQIGASYDDHFMKFSFEADQTVLDILFSMLNQIP